MVKSNSLALFIFSIVFLLFSCQKELYEKQKSNEEMGIEEANFTLENGYESKIISELIKPKDFPHYTKGIIQYSKEGKLMGSLDYGDGTKDELAYLSKGDKIVVIDLSAKKKGCAYTKVITKPLIKTANCDYIVEGTIKYFKGKKWVATVDYGNGTCDEWAYKTWDKGSKTFSLKK